MTAQLDGPHTCLALANTPDELADNWSLQCECGYRTPNMIDVRDAIDMFGYHCMDAVRDWAYREGIVNAEPGDRVGAQPVRRDRPRLRLLGFPRRPQAPTGPQAPPRHLSLIPGLDDHTGG